MLLDSGADPNIDTPDDTLLGLSMSNLSVFNMLLEHGADPNRKSPVGLTPLMKAARAPGSKIGFVRRLLEVPNIELDATSDNGLTALMFAAPKALAIGARYVTTNNIQSEIVRLLLEAGADPLIKSKDKRLTAREFVSVKTAPGYKLLQDAEDLWLAREVKANRDLQEKFMATRRLRTNQTLPQKDIGDYIVRSAEYDNLCKGLQTNLNKPGVIALARSLQIPTSKQTKNQLCQAIAEILTIR
jgi:hypothetical protein